MARQADASLQAEFGLPLGLVVIDTLGACTGYHEGGGENATPPSVQAIMNILKAVSLARRIASCSVIAHFGEETSNAAPAAPPREETPAMWCWACLGEREVSGPSPIRGWPCASIRVVSRGGIHPSRSRTVAASPSLMRMATPSPPRSWIGCLPERPGWPR